MPLAEDATTLSDVVCKMCPGREAWRGWEVGGLPCEGL